MYQDCMQNKVLQCQYAARTLTDCLSHYIRPIFISGNQALYIRGLFQMNDLKISSKLVR